MDSFVIRGGKPLAGEAAVGGAKNAALPIMAAALAADGPLTLHGVPRLADVRTQADVLRHLGVAVETVGRQTCRLTVVDPEPCVAPYELVRQMRASVCVLGPLLARRGRACVSLPGGCNIGHRPIDLHLKGLAALGAEIHIDSGYVVARAGQLRGATIDLAGPRGSTVTGTCNVMIAAALARGTTVILNAACEPEVADLATCLNRMGARIAGAGTNRLVIDGVDQLCGTEHAILPDRIEAATLLCAAVMTRGAIRLRGIPPALLSAVLDALAEIGAALKTEGDVITVQAPDRLRAASIVARPFPGLPTDVQAQFTALLTQAEGLSRITDAVFPDRFMHISELMRLGADVRRDGATAIIRGPVPLSGAHVMACDLRASAALVLAGLAAAGETVIHRIYHLDRGYERLEERLRGLGADVERVRETPAVRSHSPGIAPSPHFPFDALEAHRPAATPGVTESAQPLARPA